MSDPKILGVDVTRPEKPVWKRENITKLCVTEYYSKVADRMLNFLGGRVTSTVCCPNGTDGETFFRKHPFRAPTVGLRTVGVDGKDYFAVTSARGLVREVQNGAVEFHAWACRADKTERPDVMTFDLDPDEGTDLSRVRQGARDLGAVLGGLGLPAFLKTSGGKGYHVVVPFRPAPDWDVFREFAHSVARFLEAEAGDRYTANPRMSARKGRIFIDWMRNGKGATSAAPYSLRARAGAPVSMPISWDELDEILPNGVDMFSAVRRLALPDPWAGFGKNAPSLARFSGFGGKKRTGAD